MGLGVIILIAGIAIPIGTGTTVSVPDPNCRLIIQQYGGSGYQCPSGPPNGQLLNTPTYVTETVYPYGVAGGIVALIGLVTMFIGGEIASSEPIEGPQQDFQDSSGPPG